MQYFIKGDATIEFEFEIICSDTVIGERHIFIFVKHASLIRLLGAMQRWRDESAVL